MSFQSCATRQNDGSHGRGYWHGEPWKPVEILAMVLGFIVFWPIGLARLGLEILAEEIRLPRRHCFFRARKMGKMGEPDTRFRRLGLCGK